MAVNGFIFVGFDYGDKLLFSDKCKKRLGFACLKTVWRFHFGISKFVFLISLEKQFKFVANQSNESGNSPFPVWWPRRQEIWYLSGELVSCLSHLKTLRRPPHGLCNQLISVFLFVVRKNLVKEIHVHTPEIPQEYGLGQEPQRWGPLGSKSPRNSPRG